MLLFMLTAREESSCADPWLQTACSILDSRSRSRGTRVCQHRNRHSSWLQNRHNRCHSKRALTPKEGPHWSIRQIGWETRLAKSTLDRIWQVFGLEPNRQKHFKLSNDPVFIEKLRDIRGCICIHQKNAVVLFGDEKSQIQTLERTR